MVAKPLRPVQGWAGKELNFKLREGYQASLVAQLVICAIRT